MPRLPRSAPIQRAARLPRRGTGGTLLGVFIGLVLGIALAATVGLYVTGGWKAYQQQVAGGRESRDAAREPSKSAKADADKPRFDFYKILPGGEEAKVAPAKPAPPDRTLADKAAQASSGRVPAEAPPVADKGKAADSSRVRRSRREGAGSLLAAGRLVLERIRRGEPARAARARGLGGAVAAGHASRQGGSLSRAPRPVRQRRRAEPHQGRARPPRLRRRGHPLLTVRAVPREPASSYCDQRTLLSCPRTEGECPR